MLDWQISTDFQTYVFICFDNRISHNFYILVFNQHTNADFLFFGCHVFQTWTRETARLNQDRWLRVNFGQIWGLLVHASLKINSVSTNFCCSIYMPLIFDSPFLSKDIIDFIVNWEMWAVVDDAINELARTAKMSNISHAIKL